MKEFMEKSLGGGKVASQKQFLDNDRKVLRFYAVSEDLPFLIHYFLANDTIEIREVHHPNDGRDSFPLLLKRQKLPFSMPNSEIIAFGRPFYINGVDVYTQDFFAQKYGRMFPLSGIQMPEPREPVVRQIPPYNGFG